MRAAIAAVLVVALAACTGPGGSPPPTGTPQVTDAGAVPTAQTTVQTPSADPSSGATPTPRTDPTPVEVGDSLRLRSAEGAFLVRGSYPRVRSDCVANEQPRLLARYPGTLDVRRSAGGTMDLVVTLPFERYLEGIAEVPPTWPRAALEAQAIAARTYALASTGWDGRQGETLDTPICATTACQVYAGIGVPPVPGIERWYRAVRATSGRVLLTGGRPAETLYFSTSNGRTYGNDEVFGSAPLPYLRPVVERDDGASPLSHWRVAIPLRELGIYLTRAGGWGGGRITAVRGNGSAVTVAGPGGTQVIEGDDFRLAVNTWAPCLRPAVYPPGDLPVTVPSRWVSVRTHGRRAVVTGRGWGHGVGMVQWGAHGKALRGLSTERILAFYYGGLRPARHPEPGLIHVEVSSGLTHLRIGTPAGASLDGRDLPRGTVSIAGGEELTVMFRQAP